MSGKKKAEISPEVLESMKNNGLSSAVKIAAAIVGIGVLCGTTLVVGMDQLMRRIFVNDSWPEEELSNNDWAEEELE